MKYSIIAVLALLIIGNSGCNKSDDKNNSAIRTVIISGDWKITYYYDTDHEETSNYNGFVFHFLESGSITAKRNAETGAGIWSSGNDDSQEKLIIQFSSPSLLVKLNDDWHVKSKSSNKIELEDISGGNGGTDYLTFEKQ